LPLPEPARLARQDNDGAPSQLTLKTAIAPGLRWSAKRIENRAGKPGANRRRILAGQTLTKSCNLSLIPG
jgi:hypothetical protein